MCVMKRITSLLVLLYPIAILMTPLTEVKAQDAESSSPVDIGADLMSRYVWRGTDYGSSPSIQPYIELGLGGISIPLPESVIPVGHSWSRPIDLRVQQPDKSIKVIKTRELYTLEKVDTGVATISVKTQVLTPIDDARIKAQIMQRISQGEIRFDIDAGRLLSKQLDWDTNVVGFNNAIPASTSMINTLNSRAVPVNRSACSSLRPRMRAAKSLVKIEANDNRLESAVDMMAATTAIITINPG